MDWRAIEAMTDRVVLDGNDEMIRHSPFTRDGDLDPSRPIQEFKAVLYSPDPDQIVELGQGFRATMIASQWAIAFHRADVIDGLGVRFDKEDRFRALDRDGQPWFRYVRAASHSPSIVIVYLTPLGG